MPRIRIIALHCRTVERDGAGICTPAGGFARLGNGDRRTQSFLKMLKLTGVEWNSADANVFSLLADARQRTPRDLLHPDNLLLTARSIADRWRESIDSLRAGAAHNQPSTNRRLHAAVLAANKAFFEIAGEETRAELFPDLDARLTLEVVDPATLRLVVDRQAEAVDVRDQIVTGHNIISAPDLLSSDVHVPLQVILFLRGPEPHINVWITAADLERIPSFRARITFQAVRQANVLENIAGLTLTDLVGHPLRLPSLAPA